ncbi:hypothetical protein F5Y15DRAFT_411125 [Xylariaceae sp. FL0016]|nr:hypothetical protein F5Y15DRAFT_411125 [Xylariaceae sp. FL0016]
MSSRMSTLLAMAALAVTVISAAIADRSFAHREIAENHAQGTITWSHIAAVGLEEHIQGTVQDVVSQIQAINSSFQLLPDSGKDAPSSNRRLVCGVGGVDYTNGVIEYGIKYLRGLGDALCTNGAGPGNCGRISCASDDGIWWCNDNPHPVTFPCRIFADYAEDILNGCLYRFEFPKVRGQEFDDDYGINVLVGKSPESC